MPIVNSVSGVGLISSLSQKKGVNNVADHKKQMTFTGNKPLSLFQLITNKNLSTHNKKFYLKNRINRVFYLANQELGNAVESTFTRLDEVTFNVGRFMKRIFDKKHA